MSIPFMLWCSLVLFAKYSSSLFLTHGYGCTFVWVEQNQYLWLMDLARNDVSLGEERLNAAVKLKLPLLLLVRSMVILQMMSAPSDSPK